MWTQQIWQVLLTPKLTCSTHESYSTMDITMIYKATVDVWATNILFTLLFRVKLDCQVLWILRFSLVY